MRSIKYLLIVLIIFASCADDENPTEPNESNKEIIEYFNYEIGNVSNFTFTISDNLNNTISSGERTSTLHEERNVSLKDYYIFKEEMNSTSDTQINETLLRFNSNALVQFIDTTGTFALIPDSLRTTLTLNLSSESDLFKYPLTDDETWTVFSTDIVLGTYRINVIKIEALYIKDEQLNLGSNYGTVTAEKINYAITLNFPDMSNPLLPNIQNYSTDIWFSKGIGVVKISGTKFFTNFLVGRQIDLNDTLYIENQMIK